MPRNIKAIKFWREMSLPALLRFSLAAFLLFGALGLVSILIESSIRVHAWHFVVIQALAFGGARDADMNRGIASAQGERDHWHSTSVIQR